MKVVEIDYPTALDKIDNIECDNIDIFVTLEDNTRCTLTVATPDFYYWYMKNEDQDYVPSGIPDIIVKSLTEENIKKAIDRYAENDAFWIKLYGVMGIYEDFLSEENVDKIYRSI